jgi:hypothetical protein
MLSRFPISARFPRLSSVGVAAISLALAIPGSNWATADDRTERMIGPGVRCVTITRPAGPWVIRVIEADGESPYIQPGVTFAGERGLRAAPVSVQAQRAAAETRYPIAGVNGDFFVQSPGPFEADPIGALVVGGEVISTPYPRSAFILSPDGQYGIRRFRLSAWVQRPDGARHDLTGVNQPCGGGDLVLYTPRFGPSTHTKGPAVEVSLGRLELPVRLGATYGARVGNVGEQGDGAIPADGVTLSARGAAQEFLRGLKPQDELQFRLEFDPPVPPSADVIGGGPTLVRDGRVVVKEDTEGFKPDVVAGRAPRTAVGFQGRRLLLVTVDGREPAISVGMSLVELAELMRELGCTDAMNLDGGGSTTAWVRGTVLNQPSAGQERRVAEALFLFSTAPKGPPVRLLCAPEEISILAGASCPVSLAGGEDQFFNRVPVPTGPTRWWIQPNLGSVTLSQNTAAPGSESLPASGAVLTIRPDAAPSPRAAVLHVEAASLSGEATVRIFAQPPHLLIQPQAAAVPPSGTLQLSARCLDERGRPLFSDGVPIRWSCPPEVGQVDETGLFHAAATATRGQITVEVAGALTAIPVVVGTETRLLDGFEIAGRWTGSTVPATLKATLSPADDEPHEGQRSLKLDYDFTADHATRAVYANTHLPLGRPLALRLWVRGDGGGAWLRARLRDARGQAQIVDFTRALGKLDDWRELTASISGTLIGPLTLEALYLVEPDPQAQPRGAIELDALAGDYAPTVGARRVPAGATPSLPSVGAIR